MPRKRPRVPGLKAERSFTVPLCSVHKTATQHDGEGKWVCPTCLNEFAQGLFEAKTSGRSQGGLELPSGVRDERIEIPDVQPFLPNRRARRAMGVR